MLGIRSWLPVRSSRGLSKLFASAIGRHWVAADRVPNPEKHCLQKGGKEFYQEQSARCGCQPPDTIGAAGPSSYIETLNSALAIYNKTTGALYFDPDGTGHLPAVEFAVLLHHPAITFHDLLMVA